MLLDTDRSLKAESDGGIFLGDPHENSPKVWGFFLGDPHSGSDMNKGIPINLGILTLYCN